MRFAVRISLLVHTRDTSTVTREGKLGGYKLP
jgi:hypothetical protein